MDRKQSSRYPPPPESNGDIIGWRNDYPGTKPNPSNSLVIPSNSNTNYNNSPVQAVADSLVQQQQPNRNTPPSFSLNIWDTVMNKRSTYIRAMTSRLAEIKELSTVWKNSTKDGILPPSSRRSNGHRSSTVPPVITNSSSSSSLLTVYYYTLLQLRDSSHEWTAVDVLNTLNKCNGSISIPKDYFTTESSPPEDDENNTNHNDEEEKEEDNYVTVQLHGGIPLWNYPSYPSIEVLSYVIPVIENLLYSCYEDYILVALETNKSILTAIEPLFQYAADCDEEDLKLPDSNERSMDPVMKSERMTDETKENTEESKHDDANTTEEGINFRTPNHRSFHDRWKNYTIAIQAVDTVEKTVPLLTALKSASTNPGSTARIAHGQVIKYTELHASVKHLTRSTKILRG